MSIVLLSLFIALLMGIALSGLYGLWVGSLSAGVILVLTWFLEKLTGVRIRLGRWPLAIVAPLLWGITGGTYLAPWLQRGSSSHRTVQIAPLKQDVEVDAYVNHHRIQVEKDELLYTLTLRYRDGLKLRIPGITSDPTFNGPFIMPAKKPPKIRSYKTAEGIVVKRWELTLVAVSTGPLNTPRFEILYFKDGKTHKVIVPRIAVEVGELKQPQQLLASLKPGKPPVLPEQPLEKIAWLWWAILAGTLLLGTGGVIWLSRQQGYQPPPLPPHEWFAREYNKLSLQKLLEKQEYKAHYFALSELFRGYLERRYNFPALESTTEEIFQWLRQQEGFSSDIGRDIRKILQSMETIKFAGHIPDQTESSDITDRIHSVVRRTRPSQAAGVGSDTPSQESDASTQISTNRSSDKTDHEVQR